MREVRTWKFSRLLVLLKLLLLKLLLLKLLLLKLLLLKLLLLKLLLKLLLLKLLVLKLLLLLLLLLLLKLLLLKLLLLLLLKLLLLKLLLLRLHVLAISYSQFLGFRQMYREFALFVLFQMVPDNAPRIRHSSHNERLLRLDVSKKQALQSVVHPGLELILAW